MSAPTLWEEGRWPSRRVIAMSALATAVLAISNLVLGDHIGLTFAIGFVLICGASALAVRPSDFADLLIWPPVAVVGLTLLLDIVGRSAISPAGSSFVEGLAGGFAHMTGGLFVGYAIFLVLLGIRLHVLRGGSLQMRSVRSGTHVAAQFRRQRKDQ